MNILVVQNNDHDPIGVLGEHLEKLGAQLFIWLPEHQPAPPKSPDKITYTGLIILGGHMNAHEDEKFPYLAEVVRLIHQFYAEQKPIMGVCLGAQLIARAFGSQVYPHSVPELGFSAVRRVDCTAKESWLQNFPDELQVMHWHFDTFDLPTEATLLLTNNVCKHQAYRIGTHVYGFQFHFEVTPEIVMQWLSTKNDWIKANYPHLDSQIQAQLQAYAQASAQFAEQVATDWIALLPSPVAV